MYVSRAGRLFSCVTFCGMGKYVGNYYQLPLSTNGLLMLSYYSVQVTLAWRHKWKLLPHS